MAKKDTSYGPDPQDMLSWLGNKGKSGPAPAVRGAGKVVAAPMTASASASPAPNMGGRSGMGTRAGTPAKSAVGATTGSITKPDKAAVAARKAQGDAYLANSSTDYGVGSAVNDFANKKKR